MILANCSLLSRKTTKLERKSKSQPNKWDKNVESGNINISSSSLIWRKWRKKTFSQTIINKGDGEEREGFLWRLRASFIWIFTECVSWRIDDTKKWLANIFVARHFLGESQTWKPYNWIIWFWYLEVLKKTNRKRRTWLWVSASCPSWSIIVRSLPKLLWAKWELENLILKIIF